MKHVKTFELFGKSNDNVKSNGDNLVKKIIDI